MFEKYAENALKRILLILLVRYFAMMVSLSLSLSLPLPPSLPSFFPPLLPSVCVKIFHNSK